MKEFFHHIFIPHHSNNHKARLLHADSLLIVVLIFALFTSIFYSLHQNYSSVLGTAIDMSTSELLSYTNQKREEMGLVPLHLNGDLSQAATLKAQDMLAHNYWSHNSPTGVTPWTFFKEVHYNYVYAGENLARGFSTSKDVVNAWMASPTHRANMLSNNYNDVGFGVVKGTLTGEKDTIVIVELFGSTTLQPASPSQGITTPATEQATNNILGDTASLLSAQRYYSLFNAFPFAKYISMGVVGLFLVILYIDIFVITKRKIVRVTSHSMDHLLFLGTIFIFLLLVKQGTIF